MTAREMQEAVEIELRQRDRDYEVKNKLESKEIFHFLSRAERDYVQEIYDSGINKNEENRKKLGGLIKAVQISGGSITSYAAYYPSSYRVTIPTSLLYCINERARFTLNGTTYDNVFVKPIAYDEYNVNKDNPFRKPVEEKCLRMEISDANSQLYHVVLLPSGAVLTLFYMDYVTTPNGIYISDDASGDCKLHESVHYNIVKGAVKLILGAKQEQVGYNIQSIEGKQNN